MSKKVAIITGATGGIGSEFTRQLIDEVDEIWAIGRNKAKLVALENTYGKKVKGMSIDLTKILNLDKVLFALELNDITVKYLVNNAGTGRMAASVDFSEEEIESHIATHNTAMAVLCNMCINHMEVGSRIINMASQSAFQPNPYINLYAASKAFCYSYSRALNMELRKTGITVTVVCPGWIKTDLLQTERNGLKIEFPHLAEAKDVVKKAIKDANRGKDISVYGA